MTRDPGRVWVAYACRGRRGRRGFESGVGRAARAVDAANYRAGCRPQVLRAEGGLSPDRPAAPAAGGLLAHCRVAAEPGRVIVALPNGSALVLTADDLARLEPLTRNEPEPTDA